MESIVPQTLDNDSDNGIIEQRSEIHDINQIQDAESASEDSEGQNLEDANDYFIEKVTLEGLLFYLLKSFKIKNMNDVYLY